MAFLFFRAIYEKQPSRNKKLIPFIARLSFGSRNTSKLGLPIYVDRPLAQNLSVRLGP